MKKINLGLLLATMIISVAQPLNAEEASFREDQSLQLQLLMPGGLIGYHFNKQIFFGFTSLSNVDTSTADIDNSTAVTSRLLSTEMVPEGLYGRTYSQSRVLTGQLRISPFDSSGFFLSFGGYQEGELRETLYFDSRTRTIGNNSYANTSLTMVVVRDPVLAPLFGFGWNWIYGNGISWGFDWTGGLVNEEVTQAKATITTNNSSVTSGDIALEEEKYSKTANLSAAYFTFALGMNF